MEFFNQKYAEVRFKIKLFIFMSSGGAGLGLVTGSLLLSGIANASYYLPNFFPDPVSFDFYTKVLVVRLCGSVGLGECYSGHFTNLDWLVFAQNVDLINNVLATTTLVGFSLSAFAAIYMIMLNGRE